MAEIGTIEMDEAGEEKDDEVGLEEAVAVEDSVALRVGEGSRANVVGLLKSSGA